MNAKELKAYRIALRSKLDQLEAISMTCEHCKHFPRGRCELFDDVPPEEFRTTPESCDSWVYDDVPF